MNYRDAMRKNWPEMDEKMREAIMQKTPSERIEMGFAMFAEFKQSIIRAILEENPQISEKGLRQQLFLRLYGDEFNAEECEKILQYLAS